MTNICIELDKSAALFTDPESDEGKMQNLILNMLGGLGWNDLSQDEKDLCIRCGYNPEEK